MSVSRVFAVQKPTRRDTDGSIVESMDLTPAEAFGEITFILHEAHNPFTDPSETLEGIMDVLEEEEFGPDDWLLLVGNPALIGMVSAVAMQLVGRLRFLQWSKFDQEYRPIEAQLNDDAELSGAA